MRLFAPPVVMLAVAVAIAVLVAMPPGAEAGLTLIGRIQDGSADVCWATDAEFPVPCDED
jgi:hypothetical protein